MVDPRRDEPRIQPTSSERASELPLAFANILDRAPVGYFEVDARGTIVHANRTACVQLGIDARRHDAVTFTQHLPPRSIYPFYRLVNELLASKRPSSTELLVRSADGSTSWVRFDGVVLEDGQLGATCLISMIDISKQRAADARLRASEQRLLGLIETIPDGIFVLRRGQIVFSNASAQRLVGESRADALVGRAMEELVIAEDRAVLARCLELGERPGPAMDPVELRFCGRGGRNLLIEITWMAMVFEDSNCLLCVVRDLTDRKEIQAQLAQADRLTTAGVLAAGVAHEINNPLTYIFLNLEEIAVLVAEDRPTIAVDADGVRVAAARALEGARRVRDIVKDLKSCTRDDDVVEPVLVDEVIAKTLDIARPQLRFRIEVETDLGDTPPVAANFGRLSQVFLNLIINASQAFSSAPTTRDRVRITTTQQGGEVVVRVQDTGAGIAEGARARLFEPFFTTKPVGEGSGLGLYICHQHLARYGGSICVADDPAFRTTFVVRLPCASRTASSPADHLRAQPAADTRASKPPGATSAVVSRSHEQTAPYGSAGPVSRPRSLLVIDDDGIIRRGLTAVLHPRFGDVVAAASGNEAIELLRRGGRFDLILCDVLMGEGSGPDLHRWLETYRPDMLDRIAFITGGAYTDDARRFFADKRLPCLEKPFTQAELAGFVDRVLPAHHALPAPRPVRTLGPGEHEPPKPGRWNPTGSRRRASGS